MNLQQESKTSLITRLDAIEERLKSDSFLNNQELGGEIGFYIFDYPPQYELMIRDHLASTLGKLERQSYRLLHLNLFEEIIEMLRSRKLLDKAFEMEIQKGTEALAKALKGPLEQGKVASQLSEKVHALQPQFVVLSGLGQCWPLLRGHSLLNALHAKMAQIPLVLMYPGRYTGLELYPFDFDSAEISQANYYRAFPLVPRAKHY
ncbi:MULTISPECIES: DUF1788 domain-containing protein [Shewanella]|uniref:DUF1788 domain-containing protein n=1 Tax=Shewanella TaxID=22 RepID=UPI002006A7D8|nr:MULTISPECIES: DUF1788 domain-containing protein [unclassified Shewanella]MCK7628726.1 DUF1788 domain-containing protein [Shewanella sp. JNE9-1]MCK7643976.1 DUF1788 domain-containing protein [Shewanella sp. JNE3-1]MCK7652029.1 DUF1788 domain-containing protein [Shewanella sp. JNE4-1]UPO26056.1 DUF1788 domain-containing protein [Shewanella sp. JNE10-2]UPO37042.1 DUF1788 domain-containing protein [Shewanella sp. JNE7]